MAEFVDQSQIHVKAGNGGAGCVSVRREAHVANGGPDGGDGGDGGSVWLVASNSQSSLIGFKDHPFRRAGDGAHGKGKSRHGSRGRDLEVQVPVGTVVKDSEGNTLADLSEVGARFLAGEGGRGGKGNSRFVSRSCRAPGFAEQGEIGEEFWLRLELKLIADVAIVGFPNAGKSTLISTISAAKPKVAPYPFTTLIPHLGVVRTNFDETSSSDFVIADIPGLIEGASEGKGLGLEFLRHIERARVLLYLCDLSPMDYENPNNRPSTQLEVLRKELKSFKAELVELPSITVGSKLDSALFDFSSEGLDLAVSSATGENISLLTNRLGELVESARKSQGTSPTQEVLYRIRPPEIEVIRRDDASFEIRGKAALRAVAISDFDAIGAKEYVAQQLKSIGVDLALQRAGARDGDYVYIGNFTFVYEQD